MKKIYLAKNANALLADYLTSKGFTLEFIDALSKLVATHHLWLWSPLKRGQSELGYALSVYYFRDEV